MSQVKPARKSYWITRKYLSHDGQTKIIDFGVYSTCVINEKYILNSPRFIKVYTGTDVQISQLAWLQNNPNLPQTQRETGKQLILSEMTLIKDEGIIA